MIRNCIKGCRVKHAFQDETYGIGRRVMNPLKLVSVTVGEEVDDKGNKKKKTKREPAGYRCTVCGRDTR